MSTYFILTQTITEPERYETEYVPAVMPFITKYKGEVVVADFKATPLEGTPASGVVVLKFPGESNIIDFLTDPEYQPVKKLRLSITTHANAIMAPEYQIPA
tara:strand:+ start:197 stop:499 length:303 start_codon:yes stop_codon:yes gene_type:complete